MTIHIPDWAFLLYSLALFALSIFAGWLMGREGGWDKGWDEAREVYKRKSADEMIAEFRRQRFSTKPWR